MQSEDGDRDGGSGGSLRSASVEQTATHAPYGKACVNCVRSKTRCASSPNGEKCERCNRLNKECQPAPTARKKRASRKETLSATKTAALEEKLDGIVKMLQHSRASQDTSTFTPAADQPPDRVQNTNFDPVPIRSPAEMFTSNARKDQLNQVYNAPISDNAQGRAPCGNFFARPAHWDQPNPLDAAARIEVPLIPDGSHASGHMNRLDTLLKAAEEGAKYYPLSGSSCTPAASLASSTAGTCSGSASTFMGKSTETTTPSSVTSDYPPEQEDELQECLDTYRNNMLPFFPIVCIPSSVTVQQISTERPFLWLVIRAICNKSMGRQMALGLEVRKRIGHEMLMEGTKSLDLFLGLLVFAAWGHFYVCYKPIVTTIIQLGVSLASDLALTKPVPLEPLAMLNYTTQGCPKPPHLASIVTRTLEERRGIIGLFLVSSVPRSGTFSWLNEPEGHVYWGEVSKNESKWIIGRKVGDMIAALLCFIYCQAVSAIFPRLPTSLFSVLLHLRIEPLRWTAYLEECLGHLEETNEYPTDKLLVYLVRVQLINNQISFVPWNDTSCPPGTKLHRDLYDKILCSQLKDIERSIPIELQSNDLLRLHILNTTISIHEHNLITTTTANQSLPSDPATQLNRVKDLWTCFTAVKSWYSTFFSLSSFPLSCYPHLSMAVVTQMAHCLVALYRLSTFEHPDVPWDRKLVREELDLGATVRHMAECWGIVGDNQNPGPSRESDIAQDAWSFTKRRLIGIGNWWDLKVAAMKAAEAEMEEGVMDVGEDVGTQAQQMEGLDFAPLSTEFWDDMWMRDWAMGGNEFTMDSYL